MKGSKKLRNRIVKIKLGRKPCNSTDLATLIDPLTTPRKSELREGDLSSAHSALQNQYLSAAPTA